MTQQIPTTAKSVQGPIDRVPCPWCGKPNSFRDMQEQQLLDTGNQHFCDHCGMSILVVGIRTVELVAVRKDPSGRRAPAEPGRRAPQRQLTQPQPKPGFLQKLLGK